MAEIQFDPSACKNENVPSKVSATERNFQNLTEKIQYANDRFADLENKISPILTKEPMEAPSSTRDYPGPTGVSDRLASLCIKMDDLLYNLERVAAAVDL